MPPHDPEQRPLRVTAAPAGGPPDPVDGPFVVDRLTALAHDLGNLLDGSMRCLSLARRVLQRDTGTDETGEALRKLETAYGAMERMADLVHAAMRSSGSVVGSPTLSPARAITLEEAAGHAADVLRPQAESIGVEIAVSLATDAAVLPAGPLYSVLLNGIRNAVEAIARSQPDAAGARWGRVEVSGIIRPHRPGDDPLIDTAIVEVRDDGRGFAGDPAEAFDFGFSTKGGSLGIGLALAREVVRELGGSIELVRRTDRPSAARPGMILRIYYPVVRKAGRPNG